MQRRSGHSSRRHRRSVGRSVVGSGNGVVVIVVHRHYNNIHKERIRIYIYIYGVYDFEPKARTNENSPSTRDGNRGQSQRTLRELIFMISPFFFSLSFLFSFLLSGLPVFIFFCIYIVHNTRVRNFSDVVQIRNRPGDIHHRSSRAR